MRESLVHHFDVVVVIWVLALAVGWSMLALGHAQLGSQQWTATPQTGPAWMVQGDTAP